MKAKSRRRLLISSVAMLLVAMLALGTATFAWFTTSTTTNARNIAVKTSKKSLLLVSSKDSTWTDQLSYNFGTAADANAVDTAFNTLTPVSSYDGVNWFDATAEKGQEYGAVFGGTVNTATDSGKIFYNMLNVKNDGTITTEKDVHVTASLTEAAANSGANYLRMAIVPATATTHYNDKDSTGDNRSSATVVSADSFRSNIYAVTSGDTAIKPVTGLGTAVAASDVGTTLTVGSASHEVTADDVDAGKRPLVLASADVSATKGASVDLNLGKLSAKEAKYYMLIVWFEGQDADCKDSNAGNKMPNLVFTVEESD